MRLAGRFAPGMPVWCRQDVKTWSPGIIEKVGITKLVVVILDGGDRVIQTLGPTFLAPRNPKLRGDDNPMRGAPDVRM